MTRGYLSLVLHGHLPYIRAEKQGDHREDYRFLTRAVECYLPLIHALDRLNHDSIPGCVSISLSPTLIAMMGDSRMQNQLGDHLDRLLELSARELNRTALQHELRYLTGTYHLKLLQLKNTFRQRCNSNLLFAFADLARCGRIELMTCPASHAFLPGMVAMQRQAATCQIRLGLDAFRRAFDFNPSGFWLPECAYTPELDEILGDEGVGYIVIDSRGLENASEEPVHGPHAPVYSPSGVASFARERKGTHLIGCTPEGRPLDGLFRDNTHDLIHSLPMEYLREHMPAPGVRLETGLRYYRVGRGGDEREIYERKPALNRAAENAWEFLCQAGRRAESVAWKMDRPPLQVAAYDMHVFGSEWYEGTEFLDYLLRKAHCDQSAIEILTPSEYLRRHPCNQMVTPGVSSWGEDGYFREWVGPDNAWVYRHLSRAARVMHHLCVEADEDGDRQSPSIGKNGHDLRSRALRAAARQLILAQSSDWMAMMRNEEHREYGKSRLTAHLQNFARVASQIEKKKINADEIERLERAWPIFDGLQTDAYR